MAFSLFASTPQYAGTAHPPIAKKVGFFGAVSSLLGGIETPTYQSAPTVSAAMPPVSESCEDIPLEIEAAAVLQSPGRIVVTLIIKEPSGEAEMPPPSGT